MLHNLRVRPIHKHDFVKCSSRSKWGVSVACSICESKKVKCRFLCRWISLICWMGSRSSIKGHFDTKLDYKMRFSFDLKKCQSDSLRFRGLSFDPRWTPTMLGWTFVNPNEQWRHRSISFLHKQDRRGRTPRSHLQEGLNRHTRNLYCKVEGIRVGKWYFYPLIQLLEILTVWVYICPGKKRQSGL